MESLNAIKQPSVHTSSINTSVNKHSHFTNNTLQDHRNSTKFTIYHQNIRGLSNKIDEFLISLCHSRPQIICLTEHHLKSEEGKNTSMEVFVYMSLNLFNIGLSI